MQNDMVGNVSVHELDWLNPRVEIDDSTDNKFSWKEHDLHMLRNTSIILAADGNVCKN